MSVFDLKSLIETSIATLLDDKLKDMPTKADIGSEIHALQQNNLILQSRLQEMKSRFLTLELQVERLTKTANENKIIIHLPS